MYLLLVIMFNLASVFWFVMATKEVIYLSKFCCSTHTSFIEAQANQGNAVIMCLIGLILFIGVI